MRSWRGGDVRAVYLGVLAALVTWGLFAMSLTQRVVLFARELSTHWNAT